MPVTFLLQKPTPSFQFFIHNLTCSSLLVRKPVIVIQPSSQTVALLSTATFICSATGYNVSYQWKIIPGSPIRRKRITRIKTATLKINRVKSFDDNTYTCVASNEAGSVSSKAAKLTVTGMM